HGAAQSYVALAYVALKAGKFEHAEQDATRALQAHVACGDQRGVTQARGLLRALELRPGTNCFGCRYRCLLKRYALTNYQSQSSPGTAGAVVCTAGDVVWARFVTASQRDAATTRVDASVPSTARY